MNRHLALALVLSAAGAALLAYALAGDAEDAAGAAVAGRSPAPGDLQVVPAGAALAPLRPELALGDHGTPFAMARSGANRGTRIPLPPPPPVAATPLPPLPLPER